MKTLKEMASDAYAHNIYKRPKKYWKVMNQWSLWRCPTDVLEDGIPADLATWHSERHRLRIHEANVKGWQTRREAFEIYRTKSGKRSREEFEPLNDIVDMYGECECGHAFSIDVPYSGWDCNKK